MTLTTLSLPHNKSEMDLSELIRKIEALEQPRRTALSIRYPWLKKPILSTRVLLTSLRNRLKYPISRYRLPGFLRYVIARHQSILTRRLGSSDSELQALKIINLKRACLDLNGLVIQPGQVFSLWEVLGPPTYSRGYVDGMLLSNGKILKGVGGGLCQLSNFLCWILLHADTQIIERHHHSMDVFPDSGRVLPFGSGATCLYNFVDLKIKNTSSHPLQIKIGVTDRFLKGQILSDQPARSKFSIEEHDAFFVKYHSRFYRHNTLWRNNWSRVKKSHARSYSRTLPLCCTLSAMNTYP